MSQEANFQFVPEESTPEILVIRDVGPWDRFMTVTNAAESVVFHLACAGELPNGRRLVYYDSEGDLSELLIKPGQFAGFAPHTHTAPVAS